MTASESASKALAAGPVGRAGNMGFTLVELLIVIAIIAVLAVLLFPAGTRILEESKASKCASHLRQLYTAANLYSADNNGWILATFPTGRNADGRANQGWATALFPYLTPGLDVWKAADYGKRPTGVLACPSSKFLVTASWCSDYAKNAVVNVSETSPYLLKKNGGMDSLAKVIFLADSTGGRDLSPFARTPIPGNIESRHNGKANVLFYDGHIQTLDSSDPNQVPTGASAYNHQPWMPAP